MKSMIAGLLVALLVPAAHTAAAQGLVYTATNAADGNRLLVFERDHRGGLSPIGSVATGGRGTGSGLGNQGGLVLTADRRWVLAVNAGSDEVSVLRARDATVELAHVVASGGRRPVSLAVDRDLVYVLNAGGSVGEADTVVGFRLDRRGRLRPIPGAIRPLSGPSTAPAQIGFTPDGAFLVVTERATNLIDVLPVDDDGLAGPAIVQASAGVTPFGFAFDRRGRLLVAEAGAGAPGASSASSYRIDVDGRLVVISGAVPTTQSATCWVVVTAAGHLAFTTNTGSGTVSAFRVNRAGALTLRPADGIAAETGPGSAPADAALSAGDRYLYTLNGGRGSISALRVVGGSLELVAEFTGLPAGANGLIAR